jgi:6-phosphofructokinase 1
MKKRIGILTGGGDAPGLNGIIESCSRSLIQAGYQVFGIQDGFEGVYQQSFFELTLDTILGIHADSGTLLGTSNKSSTRGQEAHFLECYKKLNLQGLIVAGGDGTFQALKAFENQIPIIGVPKTIDNDLSGTEITFGFDTACSVVSDAIDSLRHTALAHRRVILVETMGRTAGWMALGGGLASYADVILIPERPFQKNELTKYIQTQKKSRRGLMIAVSEGAFAQGESPKVAFKVEGAPQKERYGGISEAMARWIEIETGWESRHVILGHLQRSHAPTTTDRFLTLSMGVEAAQMVFENAWKKAVVYRQGKVCRAPIGDLMQEPRLVPTDHEWVEKAKALGIFI